MMGLDCISFLSIEPLHQKLDLTSEWVQVIHPDNEGDGVELIKAFDWIIVGGESGNDKGQYQYRPCEMDWINLIVDQCEEAEVPVFVKQLGTDLSKQLKMSDRHGANIEEFPEHLQLRQFPGHYGNCVYLQESK